MMVEQPDELGLEKAALFPSGYPERSAEIDTTKKATHAEPKGSKLEL